MYFYFKLRAMILEDATKEAFGYYPSALTPQSNKPILAACDDCSKIRKISKYNYHPLCKSCSMKGNTNSLSYKHTDEHIALSRAGRKGYTHTEETKAKISASEKGKIVTEETKALLSKNHTDFRGDNNPRWKGSISFEPYCVKFNDAFKEYIRAKFGYKCFLCPTTQAENGKKLSVHHVNYNKDCGCDGDKTCQFVPLCISCHTKTNGKRDYWQKLITDKLHSTIIGWDV
jgi:hypothetical protein